MGLGLSVPGEIESAASCRRTGQPLDFARGQKSEAARVQLGIARVLTKCELALQDDNVLVRFVPVGWDHMPGGKSHQQVHTTGGRIFAQEDRLRARSVSLF